MVLAAGCGPPARVPLSPQDRGELQRLLAASRAGVPFAASGKVRFESRDGEIEGDLEVRVAPPQRAWAEVRSGALFSLVERRVVVVLPGDGHLLVYDEKGDSLQRIPFEESIAARLLPAAGPAALLDVLTGRIGRLPALERADLTANVCVSARGADRVYSVADGSGGSDGTLALWVRGGELRRLEWRVGDRVRLDVRYDRFVPVGSERLPTRLEVSSPESGLRAIVSLTEVQAREGFAPEDFEIGTGRNPDRDRGVQGG